MRIWFIKICEKEDREIMGVGLFDCYRPSVTLAEYLNSFATKH
jgi:hypothetical protein